MNFNRQPTLRLSVPKQMPGQRTVVTENSEEFFTVCKQADNGELKIFGVKQGERNSQWVFQVKKNNIEK